MQEAAPRPRAAAAARPSQVPHRRLESCFLRSGSWPRNDCVGHHKRHCRVVYMPQVLFRCGVGQLAVLRPCNWKPATGSRGDARAPGKCGLCMRGVGAGMMWLAGRRAGRAGVAMGTRSVVRDGWICAHALPHFLVSCAVETERWNRTPSDEADKYDLEHDLELEFADHLCQIVHQVQLAEHPFNINVPRGDRL